MTFGELCRSIYDQLSIEESDRQKTDIVKAAINTSQRDLAKLFPLINETILQPVSRINALPSDFLVPIMMVHSEYGNIDKDVYGKFSGKSLIVTDDFIGDDYSIDLVYGKSPAVMKLAADVIEIEDTALDALQYLTLFTITKDEAYQVMYQAAVNASMTIPTPLNQTTTKSETVTNVVFGTDVISTIYD
jgi:hypothetical protein